MEILFWFYHMALPLLGWWWVLEQVPKMAGFAVSAPWGKDFLRDFLRSVSLTLLHATPEKHMQATFATALPERVKRLWLGLRSLSYGLIFIFLFLVWNMVPASVPIALGLVLFVIAQWWKPARGLALFFLALGLFLQGSDQLVHSVSQLTESLESPAWIYDLALNFFPGALLGVVVGALLRGLFRLSGVAWWAGLGLLLSGLLSLGGAWGFFLGEFLFSAAEDFFRYRDREMRIRHLGALTLGGIFLLLTTPIQTLVMEMFSDAYSIQIRVLQLAVMTFLFLLVESAAALVFFHFYHLEKSAD